MGWHQWLKTTLGGPHAEMPVEHGAKSVIRIISQAGREQNGQFIAVSDSPLVAGEVLLH